MIVVGIGNELRGDDAIGVVVAKKLKKILGKKNVLISDSLHGCIMNIVKRSDNTVVIVDAAYMNMRPGDIKVLKKNEISKISLSTHTISPALLADFLENKGKVVYFICVQIKRIGLGDSMSMEVKKAVPRVISEVLKLAK